MFPVIIAIKETSHRWFAVSIVSIIINHVNIYIYICQHVPRFDVFKVAYGYFIGRLLHPRNFLYRMGGGHPSDKGILYDIIRYY